MQIGKPLGEFALIARYFAPLARGFPGAYGLEDDVAVITPSPGMELVAKTDAIVGSVHFLDGDPPDLVAKKALRVNLSDLAAKGAVARAYLVDLMLPEAVDEGWVAAFARGLGEDQALYGVHLIGGDTDRTPGPVAIAIAALGEVPEGKTIRRGGAHTGDTLYVSGTIGDAAFGLKVLKGALAGLEESAARFLARRYRLPEPRVKLGPRLLGLASAALDVSDGLVADLKHLCEVSRLSAVVEAPRVPLSPAARAAIAVSKEGLALALSGGDDYEILFTAPKEAASALARLGRELALPITAIGEMIASRGEEHAATVRDEKGRPMTLASEGWTHF
jgi:thiamine-monophosphate kinase